MHIVCKGTDTCWKCWSSWNNSSLTTLSVYLILAVIKCQRSTRFGISPVHHALYPNKSHLQIYAHHSVTISEPKHRVVGFFWKLSYRRNGRNNWKFSENYLTGEKVEIIKSRLYLIWNVTNIYHILTDFTTPVLYILHIE